MNVVYYGSLGFHTLNIQVTDTICEQVPSAIWSGIGSTSKEVCTNVSCWLSATMILNVTETCLSAVTVPLETGEGLFLNISEIFLLKLFSQVGA